MLITGERKGYKKTVGWIRLDSLGAEAHHFRYLYTMISIPDSLQGALTLSIIDFFLSFVIISGIGVLLALFPLVNRRWKLDESKLKQGH